MRIASVLLLLACLPCLGQSPAPGQELSDWNQRFSYYLHRTYSWQRMSMLAAETTFDHTLTKSHVWDRDLPGFGCRYGNSFGRRLVRNTIEFGMGGLLHEDTRLRPSRETHMSKRLRHVLRQSFYSSGERTGFAYSRLGSTVGGTLISAYWHPRHQTLGDITTNIGSSYLGTIQNSLMTEFSPDLKRFGLRIYRRLRPANPTQDLMPVD